MSYDVYLEADTGGPDLVEIFTCNHTSNTSRMWRSAGCDIAEFHGKAASEMVTPLSFAIENIEADRARYREMEPDNKWGTVESTLNFLRTLHDACEKHPKTKVVVWR